MTDFTKGPIHKLPEGISRYEIVYRMMQDDETWKAYRMWKTDKSGKDEEIGKELYARLATKLRPFEILSVTELGSEVPIQTGRASLVLSPSEYNSLKEGERARFSKAEVKERAKEIGLWYPGMEEKFDA